MKLWSVNLFCLMTIMFLHLSAWSSMNTNGENGVVRTISAKPYGKASMNIGVGIGLQQAADYFDGQVKNDLIDPVIVGKDGKKYSTGDLEPARLFSSNLFFGIAPLSFWDISCALPFYYDWSGLNEMHDGGLGDIELSTKISPPPVGKMFYQGYLISGTLPTGMKKNGLFPRHAYYLDNKFDNPAESFYSANNPTIKGLILLTFDIGAHEPKIPIVINANMGGVFTVSDKRQRNTVIGSLALEYTPIYFLTLFTDLYGESRFSNFSSAINPTNDPVYFSPGFKINTPSGMYLQFSGDISLSSKRNGDRLNWSPNYGGGEGYKYSTGVLPNYGIQFMVGWKGFITIQDDDKDGIKNDRDRCPKNAEDMDGFEDDDGCPDFDNDKDGIPDLKDKCPNDPEDKDGFQDEDGCPDIDNDGDGIVDLKDQCPNSAEDFDGFQDLDGCPDPDNDNDGVVDSLDKCPNDIEDFDNYQDDDGCPDLDNDKDGIPDLKDKCPLTPENYNNYRDDDGCPDTIPKAEPEPEPEPDMPKLQTLHGISFRNGSSEMTFESYRYLDPIIKQMKQYSTVEIEVRGHTDGVGDYTKNMQLSQMRAESVRQYLISKGIDGSRIRAAGFGSSNPIADNKTAAGRIQNRRIEIVRTK